MNLCDELKDAVNDISCDGEELKRASRDASLFEITPAAVVYPQDAREVEKLVEFVSENKKKNPELSLTARAGGTDMTGGPLGESVVVDFRKMNAILGVDDENGTPSASVQPGAYYRDFEKATLAKGLIMPSFPASREICMVGGMAANNAGGEKTLKYGKTADYVMELKVVLRDGKEHIIKPVSGEELKNKLNDKTVEGEIYRKVHTLVKKNDAIIKEARPNVSKNSAGYALWDVWDGETLDLTKLIIGSQGTLGLITEIKFRLVKPHKHSRMLVVFLRDISSLGKIVGAVLEEEPETFESYDDHTIKLAIKFLPQFLKLLKGNFISIAMRFIPELRLFLTGGWPKMILIAEFTGDDPGEPAMRAKRAEEKLKQFKVKTRITKSGKEAEKYKVVRRESFNLLRNKIKDKQTAPFIDDIIVRPEDLPEFLPKLQEILDRYDMLYTIAGHIGDANFHIIPLVDISNPNIKQIIPELAVEVYNLVFSYGGSMTAEHNDGLIRSPYLKDMYGEEICSLFAEIKEIFDQENIFNPGKKVGSSFQYALAHLKKTS